MTIHLIANRFAGKGVKPLRRLLADQPIEWHLPGDIDEASQLIRSLRGQAERLIFAGGDGTFHLASRVLGDGQTPDQEVGFIATGTGSDFLRSLGADSLEEQVATALSGATRPFRPGQVEGAGGLQSFTNVASLGVSAAVAHAVEGYLKSLGAFGYTVAMIQGILTYRSTRDRLGRWRAVDARARLPDGCRLRTVLRRRKMITPKRIHLATGSMRSPCVMKAPSPRSKPRAASTQVSISTCPFANIAAVRRSGFRVKGSGPSSTVSSAP